MSSALRKVKLLPDFVAVSRKLRESWLKMYTAAAWSVSSCCLILQIAVRNPFLGTYLCAYLWRKAAMEFIDKVSRCKIRCLAVFSPKRNLCAMLSRRKSICPVICLVLRYNMPCIDLLPFEQLDCC